MKAVGIALIWGITLAGAIFLGLIGQSGWAGLVVIGGLLMTAEV